MHPKCPHCFFYDHEKHILMDKEDEEGEYYECPECGEQYT